MKGPVKEEKNLLTVIEAAEVFGLSRRKMLRLAETDGLRFMAFYGTRKLVIRDEFVKYLAQPGVREELKNGTPRTKKRLKA